MPAHDGDALLGKCRLRVKPPELEGHLRRAVADLAGGGRNAIDHRVPQRRIVDVHHPTLNDDLLQQALDAFYGIRKMERVRKKPSTSELVDWIAMLLASGIDTVNLSSQTPYLGTLLKKEQDLIAFGQHLSGPTRRRY